MNNGRKMNRSNQIIKGTNVVQEEQNNRHVETKSVEACIDKIVDSIFCFNDFFFNDKC